MIAKEISLLKLTFCAVVFGALFTLPAMAAGVLYDCDLDAKRAKGWVSNKMAFVFEDNGSVKVVDSVLLHYVGNPVAARMRKSGDVARLNWSISGAVDNAQQFIPTFSYTAKLNLKTLSLSVSAKPAYFPQRFSGKGSCVKRNSTKGFPKG